MWTGLDIAGNPISQSFIDPEVYDDILPIYKPSQKILEIAKCKLVLYVLFIISFFKLLFQHLPDFWISCIYINIRDKSKLIFQSPNLVYHILKRRAFIFFCKYDMYFLVIEPGYNYAK